MDKKTPSIFLKKFNTLASIIFMIFVYINSASADCPSWETQYYQLSVIANNNSVITVRHRGDFTTDIPENSLGAFERSYQNCRAAIETDVRLTKDNELVVFHDINIGKMLEKDYDPLLNTGPNPELKSLTLDELQQKKLLTITREKTNYTVPTVDEMLHNYLDKNGQSLIYLEVKDAAAIIPTAMAIYRVSLREPSLVKRVIVKFNMAEYPTPNDWFAMLNENNIKEEIMANPVISPIAAKRINEGPKIDPINGADYRDNASRAVALWSNAKETIVPNIEVVIKDSTDFKSVIEKDSIYQGKYIAPANLDISNTNEATMARMVAIIKFYKKPLGAFVPVPDYILWRPGVITGITVPNVIPDTVGNINIIKAYFQNNSACCYDLADRLGVFDVFPRVVIRENYDYRHILDWNRSIGVNMITADDTDTIDEYYAKNQVLDRVAMPILIPPTKNMHSTLSWDFHPEFNVSKSTVVNIKAWNGESSVWWGGQTCLYTDSSTHEEKYAWVYQCGNFNAENAGYSDSLITKVVDSPRYGSLIQIYSAQYSPISDTPHCLQISGFYNDASWGTDCDPENKATLFKQDMKGHLQAMYYVDNPLSPNQPNEYLYLFNHSIYYDLFYGKIRTTQQLDENNWNKWLIELAPSNN
ncbi:glycerophosphodiester phosphodiesterase family protein [Providencia stuartii]